MNKLKKCDIKCFWKCALVRAVKSMAQAAVAALGTTALITDVDWKIVISTATMTGLLSLLTSISSGLPEVPEVGETVEPTEEQ